MELMIDIETLSTQPNALILSVGMCFFSKDFSAPVIEGSVVYPSLEQKGSHIDPQTVRWWMGQTDSAKAVFSDKVEAQRAPLVVACVEIMEAINNADHIWAKDPDFDCVILARFIDAYSQSGFDWPFWKNRSVRTMLDLCPEAKQLPFSGTQHDALADAVHQAKQMQMCFANLQVR